MAVAPPSMRNLPLSVLAAGFDAFIDIGQKRSENVFNVLLLQHFFQFDQ